MFGDPLDVGGRGSTVEIAGLWLSVACGMVGVYGYTDVGRDESVAFR